jgi:hypothetical protein
MAKFKVLAGPFGVGLSGSMVTDFWFGRVQSIRLPLAPAKNEDVPPIALAKVVAISSADVGAIAAKMGATVLSASTRKHEEMVFAGLVLGDGRKALIHCKSDDFQRLTAVAFNNQQGLSQPKDWGHFTRVSSLAGALGLGIVLSAIVSAGDAEPSTSAISMFIMPLMMVAVFSLIKPILFIPSRGHAFGLLVGLTMVSAAATRADDGLASTATSMQASRDLASVLAKVPEHVTGPMSPEGYPDTYRQLGSARFSNASDLLPWAARAVALSEHCPAVTHAALLPRFTTRDAFVYFVDCGNDGARVHTRFYVTEAQALQYKSVLEPMHEGDTVNGIEPLPRVEDMFPYTAFDAWTTCNETARLRMVSSQSFQAGNWPGLFSAVPEFDGTLTVEASYSAVNAFNARLDGAYSCTVDQRTGQITRFRIS